MQEFEVWCPEYGQTRDDAKTIAAFDAKLAATTWAHWHDGRILAYTTGETEMPKENQK